MLDNEISLPLDLHAVQLSDVLNNVNIQCQKQDDCSAEEWSASFPSMQIGRH